MWGHWKTILVCASITQEIIQKNSIRSSKPKSQKLLSLWDNEITSDEPKSEKLLSLRDNEITSDGVGNDAIAAGQATV